MKYKKGSKSQENTVSVQIGKQSLTASQKSHIQRLLKQKKTVRVVLLKAAHKDKESIGRELDSLGKNKRVGFVYTITP
jgi:RNA-binding protein YhbY